MPGGHIVLTDNIFGSLDEFHERLAPLGLDIEVAAATDETTLAAAARSALGLIVVYAQITQRVIAAAADARCRIISRCGIGYDNIDIQAATRHHIQVTYVPDYCIGEVADHTIALLLAFARQIVPSVSITTTGGWHIPRDRPIHRLQGRRLTLIGLGRIGREVAARAGALGMKVAAYDPYLRDSNTRNVEVRAILADALADADFVSLHAPLTTENRHLIRKETIEKMKRAPILINTARGGLIDLTDVTAALEDGRLSGVALDVSEQEPLPPDHPLRTSSSAVITPHMAYFSEEAQSELKSRAADEVARAVLGQPPRCPVNRFEVQHVD